MNSTFKLLKPQIYSHVPIPVFDFLHVYNPSSLQFKRIILWGYYQFISNNNNLKQKWSQNTIQVI